MNRAVEITQKIDNDIEKMNSLLTAELAESSPIFNDFIRPLAMARGKQLRARLCLHIANTRESIETQRLWIAGAIEFLHLATLIHDDVLDEADLRRGVETVHTKEGNKAAILSGDHLFAKAFHMIGNGQDISYLKIFTDVISNLVEGEFLQMSDEGKINQDVERYLLKTKKKTADLIETAIELGARMAKYSEEEIQAFKEYGYSLGMLFQITDDFLDYTAKEEEAGKPVGNDLVEGVLTYPILSIKTAENEAFLEEEIRAIMNGKSSESLIKYVEEQGGLKNTIALAKDYEKAAREALDRLPSFDGKELLYDNITALLYRTV